MLQREGLIDSEPNRRVRVAELSVVDLEGCTPLGS
jgi:DNA-binding GntR family transcriptional regulator